LNTAAILGANASGKSTLLRGMFEMVNFITKSNLEVGSAIEAYDNFAFNEETQNAPIVFTIDFVVKKIKHTYRLVFDRTNIHDEVLEYYPLNKKSVLLQRSFQEVIDKTHTGVLGTPSKGEQYKLFHNQLFLQKFGRDIPHEHLSEVYLYFKNINIVNTVNTPALFRAERHIKTLCSNSATFQEKLNKLIRWADTGINRIQVDTVDESHFQFPEHVPKVTKARILEAHKYELNTYHDYFKGDTLSHQNESFPFEKESQGTKTLFVLGGLLLEAIEKGVPIFIDELETSLHSVLTQELISLFKDKKLNVNNSQLIFTSHDTTILNKNSLRKDQIWFAEKNHKGETDLFSLQDFSDVREDTLFDKWYLAGKFGALPQIKSVSSYTDSILEDEQK